MAVDINNVYQKVLALINKEQRGYITPQEFNLLADKAQKEIYENYFHGVKMAEQKPTSQKTYADETEMLEEKLHPFHVDSTITNAINSDTGGYFSTITLPSSLWKIISITRDSNFVEPKNKSEIAYTENNPLTKATIKRSVYVREDSGSITIYPTLTAETSFEVSYYKSPSPPKWGYVVVNKKALYDTTLTTNFELHESEEENIVYRILMLSGMIAKQPDVAQAGSQGMQMTKQEQNS